MGKIKFLSFLIVVSALYGCSLQNSNKNTSKTDDPIFPVDDDDKEDPDMSKNSYIKYEGVGIPNDYNAYSNEVKKGNDWNNDAVEYGIVKSPYYSFNVYNNDEKTACEVYAANGVDGISSFVCVNKVTDEVKCELVSAEEVKKVEIHNVLGGTIAYEINGNVVSFVLKEETSYTFIINGKLSKALTVFFESKIKQSNFQYANQFTIRTINPGLHDGTILVNDNERIVFAAGKHQIRNVTLSSNCEVYFEDGAYLECIAPSKDKDHVIQESDWMGLTRYDAVFNAQDEVNIKVYGHGIIDMAKIPLHGRTGFNALRVNGLTIEGVMFNNAAEWTLPVFCCRNVNISKTKIFGYRQNSDGFAVVDCNNVKVDNCFARSGDDLFEIKSMYGAETIEIKDIYFTNCVAWPEKARGYGIIAETCRDIKDVYYKNCTVIAYPSTWMDALGALIVYVENNGKISNVHFEDFTINHCSFYPINVTLASSSQGSISDIYFKNIKYNDSVKVRLCNQTSKKVDHIVFEQVYMGSTKIKNTDYYVYKTGTLTNLNFF